MSEQSPPEDDSSQAVAENPAHHVSRRRVMYKVMLFQLKLLADGVRDIILSPLSIIAMLIGLFAGDRNPDKYFNRLLKFGRRSDMWINLFDMHKGKHTADAWIAPLEDRLKRKYSDSVDDQHWMSRGSKRMNTALDHVNSEIESKRRSIEGEQEEK